MFPEFRVKRVSAECIIGEVSRTSQGEEAWVGDNYLGYLFRGAVIVLGRWKKIGEGWMFSPKETSSVEILKTTGTWEILDGYWGERAELVLDEKREWKRVAVSPRDAVQVRPGLITPSESGNPGETIPNGWDHEHCAICWEKMGTGGQSHGFVSAQDWVCEKCYSDFVKTRSLSFVPPPN